MHAYELHVAIIYLRSRKESIAGTLVDLIITRITTLRVARSTLGASKYVLVG